MAILVLTTEHAAFADLGRELNGAHVLEVAHDLETGVELLGRPWTLVIVDQSLAGDTTTEFVAAAVAAGQRVIVTTRRPTLPLTLSALRAGAADVLALPLDAQRVRELAEPPAAAPRAASAGPDTATASLIGESPALLDAFRTAARAAETDVPVLVVGETGTGKELLARVIHENGPRSAGPFVTVNCAAIPAHLLESELFGHEPGALAGTFGRRIGRAQRAQGGTLFLDEIGALAPPLQAKLMRMLQSGVIEPIGADSPQSIDVRLIAATHFDLADAVSQERFRADLFYALGAVEIALPPLRERGTDIQLLAQHFLRELSISCGRDVRQIDAAAMERLQRFTWPGNIRQLRAALARAVVLAEDQVLHASHLPPEIVGIPPRPRAAVGEFSSLAELERQHIEDALALTAGHLGQAARLLGIHRNTLRRKLEALGLPQD